MDNVIYLNWRWILSDEPQAVQELCVYRLYSSAPINWRHYQFTEHLHFCFYHTPVTVTVTVVVVVVVEVEVVVVVVVRSVLSGEVY